MADLAVLIGGPMTQSCRALLARGVTGRFETWREMTARLTGDIEAAAKLDVKE
jgi:hypothetical protein